MPLIIPIQDAPLLEATIAGVIAGSTEMTGDLTVRLGLRGNLIGSTQMVGGIGGTMTLAGTLIGSTDMGGFLRINDEPNIFLAGLLEGSTQLTGSMNTNIGLTDELTGSTDMTGDLFVTSPLDLSFMLFVDVLDSAVVSAQSNNIRRYTAKMLVNGVDVPIRRAELEASADTLGTELRVTLASPDVSQVTLTSDITFQIGIWTGAVYQYVPVITGGKLSSLDRQVKNADQRPMDEVIVTIIDVVADRWNRAPRTPVHLYDPNLIDAPTQSEISAQKIQLADGGYILPNNLPIAGMRLRDVLHEAYVTGTGFVSVMTNIPNFPVSQADFTLDGGYDAGVRPLLQLFAPLLFTDQSNRLFVIDPDAPLPAGFTPRDFLPSSIIGLNDSVPQREPLNSILIRMRTLDGGGEVFTERIDQDHQESGTFGSNDHVQTDMFRRVREFRMADNPTVVIREEVVEETSTTHDSAFNVIEHTTMAEHFDALGRKTGYSRRIDRRLPDVDADGAMVLMVDALVEEQSIVYTTNPLNPNEDVQDRVTTVQSGIVVVDEDHEYLGEAYRIPLTDAHVSGYVDPDGSMHLETATIKTTVEQLRVRGDQVDVQIRVINHLSNSPSRTSITSRPGSVTLNRRKQGSSRTVLLTIDGTEPDGRRALVFDAGELPGDIAMTLGRRRLERLNRPPREIMIPPAYIDLSIRRGSVIRPKDRNNVAIGVYIVTGYTIVVEEFNSARGIQASMTISARELTA